MNNTSFFSLEPLLAHLRINRIKKYLKKNSRIIDFGCGSNFALLNCFPKKYFTKYVGIDPLASSKLINDSVEIIKSKIEKSIVKENNFDTVVMLALLEHVDDPEKIVNKAYKLLKKNGVVVATTPSIIAKPVLEFLSYKLGIVSKREIEEHKQYFTPRFIKNIFYNVGFKNVIIKRFEFGFNILIVAKK